jgi:hypothetical protein
MEMVADTINTYPDGLSNGLNEKVAGTEIPFDYELFDGNLLLWDSNIVGAINQSPLYYLIHKR